MSDPAKISLQNTLSGKKEPLKTLQPGQVNLYCCGPTVYSYTHIGNARAAITPDLIVRVLRHAGYTVSYARNITDVDDKIIKAAQTKGTEASEISKEFEDAYLKELNSLKLLTPEHNPHATEYIKEMVALIEELIAGGFAYEANTPFGSDVYFRVSKKKDYGKLSKRNIDDLMSGARIEPGEAKEDPLDFALWKAAKEGEPSWESPWGAGRPGWHIECSAMAGKHFPNGLDIHMGGLDLIFPHHENEIAQSEALKEDSCFSTYWLHNGMLTIEREKMSKSLGNVFLTKDFLEKFGPETLKLMILQHHYRSPIDFSVESILRTEALVERLYHGKCELESQKIPIEPAPSNKLVQQMTQALFDDFNSAKALGFLLKELRVAFKQNDAESWNQWAGGFELFQKIYGIGHAPAQQERTAIRKRRFARSGKGDDFCQKIEGLIEKRAQMRAQKNFEAADDLRKEIEQLGVLLMDGPDGTAWTLSAQEAL